MLAFILFCAGGCSLPTRALLGNASEGFEGCDNAADDAEIEELVEDADGMSGVIVGEAGRVRFEVSVGAETPLETRGPDVPTHEVDVRFTDENGAPFLMQIGGHQPMDPQWWADLNEIPPVGDREALLELVPAAADEAKRRGSPEVVLQALEGARSAASQFDPEPPELIDRGDAAPPPAASYTQKLYRKKKAAWNLSSSTLGEHSAVYVYVYSSSGALVSSYYTCNHGTCANSSSMSTYKSGSYTTSGIVANYLCSTSWGLTSGTHTCNDDTLMQYYVLFYNTTSPTSSTCSDSSLRKTAP